MECWAIKPSDATNSFLTGLSTESLKKQQVENTCTMEAHKISEANKNFIGNSSLDHSVYIVKILVVFY